MDLKLGKLYQIHGHLNRFFAKDLNTLSLLYTSLLYTPGRRQNEVTLDKMIFIPLKFIKIIDTGLNFNKRLVYEILLNGSIVYVGFQEVDKFHIKEL